MELKIILTANEIAKTQVKNKIVVAIDTFRATTTIVTALANKAREIIPVLNVSEALDYKELEDVILAGEREGEKIPEMELGNSPGDYIEDLVKDKRIVLTTTNGTKTLVRLKSAKKIIIASFLNLKEVAVEIKNENELIICCAGTQGEFSLEDFLTAGGLIYRLKELKVDLELSDLSLLAYQSYLKNKDNLFEFLSKSQNGARLINLGKKADINHALKEDHFSLIPIYSNGSITV